MKTPLIPRKSYANWMLAVLVVNILLCFAFVGLFLLILIGAWHIIDALVYVALGDQRRKKYLLVVAAYFAIMVLAPQIGDIDTIVRMGYLLVVSYLIGFWYWSIVNSHANERVEEEDKPAAEIEDHLIV